MSSKHNEQEAMRQAVGTLWDSNNPLLLTDGYKPSHWRMYPPGLQRLQSYFESRLGAKFETSVFFGLQYYVQRYLAGKVLTPERVEEASRFWAQYFGTSTVFNRALWERMLEKYQGYLPLTIRAVPEGTIVPQGCAMMVVENTDLEFAEAVNYLAETLLSKVWYPTTVATQSREIKKVVNRWVRASAGPTEAVSWMVHDFGYRGVSSEETAQLGGAAHLLSFYGSDTVAGDLFLRNWYSGNTAPLVSGSIPASEHSTVTTWGESHEVKFLENLLQAYPEGLVANVIDSYDPQRYICTYAAKFKEQIMSRKGKVVFRPDSGDPRTMVLQVLEWLGQIFGWTYNEGGYKVLHPSVGVIYGDGMNFETIQELYGTVVGHKWAAHNVAVGSGGGLLQQVNRDTQRFAFKACWALVDDNPRDVFKKPSSDPSKDSKRGRLLVLPVDGLTPSLRTYREEDVRQLDAEQDVLETVFEDGQLTRFQTLDDIRARAAL